MNKNMKKTKKSFLVLLMTIIMLLSTSILVFAADPATWISQKNASELPGSVTRYLHTDSSDLGTDFITVTTKDGAVYYIKGDEIDNISSQIDKHESSNEAQEQIEQMDNWFTLKPNLEYAGRTLAPVAGFISTVVGMAVMLITGLMTLNTAFDIAYIAFPVIRGKMIDSKNSGGAMAKKNADGSTSLRIVTDEAQFAVEQATTQNGGGNAMVTYFKKRILSYILLAIMLFILLTGNISLITDLAVKVAMGLIEVLLEVAG